ncbi:NAD(P)H-binding protein [Nocardia sp. NPDC057663]|uniref:NAD(P)H-binding protein n=1 Tax=Nocardia sp. NPDC057663 TaxID=3346201 RepID=UPI0036735CFB
MGENNIRRIVLASTQGAGDDWSHLSPLMKAIIKMSNLDAGFTDHDGVDQAVRSSGADWTLVRAVALSDKPTTNPVHAAERGTGKPATRINRTALADFMLDAVEQNTWVRQAPLVWNARG